MNRALQTFCLLCTLFVVTLCDVPSIQAEMLVNSRPILGEGSNYDTRRKVLFWIDITGKSVHMYNPATNQDKYFIVDQFIGFIVLTKSGDGLIMGLRDGIAHGTFRYSEGEISGIDVRLIKRVEEEKEHNRFNDGKCDPAGNLWGGTMELDCKQGQGNLYSFRYKPESGTLNMTKVIADTTISNGIVWSRDQRTMYWTETIEGSIYAFDYNVRTMQISNKRLAYKAAPGAGSPDGMTIDSDDKLWVAHYGGSSGHSCRSKHKKRVVPS
ncbi:gluconolactonase [Acrasis kona]|uniref:Gluconolactonase n=1 Tax=Acrasis kona TaxID=1008807 RepID=A0AAW2Z486_9EUKA